MKKPQQSAPVRAEIVSENPGNGGVGEDGHTQFDSPELNERGFETADKLEINGWFGSAKKIQTSLEHYLAEFRSIPEKKPFNIAEHITLRKKKRPTTSNPLLEAPSYDRNWK